MCFHIAFLCVLGLLPNRQKSTYHFMFNELKLIALQMQLNFAPETIMSDFESGLLVVVSAEVSFFTFLESNLRTFVFNSFRQQYTLLAISISLKPYIEQYNALAYRHPIMMMMMMILKQYCPKWMALPLLPEPIIEDTYDELIAAMPQQLKDALKNLLKYFQQQWFVKVPISQ